MLGVIVAAARWMIGRYAGGFTAPRRQALGVSALSLMLLAEFAPVA